MPSDDKRFCLFFSLMLTLSCGAAWALSPTEVFQRVSPMVVEVQAQDTHSTPLPYGHGSGVVMAPAQVVMNCHLLDDAAAIHIVQASKTLPATLEHRDLGRDLCLLKVPTLQRAQYENEPGPPDLTLHWQPKAIALENAQDWPGLLQHAQIWVRAEPETSVAHLVLGLGSVK